MTQRPPCPLPSHPLPLVPDTDTETLTLDEARAEAARCLYLSVCRGCEVCLLICPDQAITLDEATGRPIVDLSYCKSCGLCARFCPKGAITMVLEVDKTSSTNAS